MAKKKKVIARCRVEFVWSGKKRGNLFSEEGDEGREWFKKGGFGRNNAGVNCGGCLASMTGASTQVPLLGELQTKATTGGSVHWGTRTER